MADPFEGVRSPAASGVLDRYEEATGFARMVWLPDERDRSEPNRPRRRVRILYFPRYSWQDEPRGTAAQRVRVAIDLTLPDVPVGHLPFYFELTSTEANPDYPTAPRHETLYLVVDRAVVVHLPDDAEHGSGPWYRIPLPENAWFFRRLPPLHVHIRRVQRVAEVPQSVLDAFDADAVPQQWQGAGVRRVLTHGSGVQTSEILRPVVLRRPALGGGTTLVLGRARYLQEASFMGAGPPRTTGITVLARVSLLYADSSRPAAYQIAVDEPTAGALRVNILYDARVEVHLAVDALWVDTARSLGLDALSARLEWLQSDWFIDLRLRRVGYRSVGRPLERVTQIGDRWTGASQLGQLASVTALENPSRELALSMGLLAAGFVPVIGDLVDIGDFVHALVTGEDLAGSEVSDDELVFMALALLPGVPGQVRRLAGFAEAADRVRRSGVRFEDLLAVLRQHRPGIVEAIATRTGQARSVVELLQRLVQAGGRRTEQFLAQRAVRFGRIPQEAVERIVRAAGRG